MIQTMHDISDNVFGGLQHTWHDLSVLNILRGRDHGLPDYNTARKQLGLPPLKAWEDINPWLAKHQPQVNHKKHSSMCGEFMTKKLNA